MTFTETVDSVWVVVPIVLVVMFLLPMLPRAKDGIMSIYDAGIFAVHLIVLAWGVLMIVEGKEAVGWALIIVAAGCFGSRLYYVLNQFERKLLTPGDSETGRW